MERLNHHWATIWTIRRAMTTTTARRTRNRILDCGGMRSLILTTTRRNTTRLPRMRSSTGRTKVLMMPS